MRLLAIVGAVLLLSPSALCASTPKACALLTNAEVAKALGSKIASKQTVTFGGGPNDTCQWTGVNLSGPNAYATHRTLTVTVGETTRAKFLEFADATPHVVRIRGLGQLAYSQGNGNLDELVVWQSGHVLTVIANLVSSPLAVEKVAARAAVARL